MKLHNVGAQSSFRAAEMNFSFDKISCDVKEQLQETHAREIEKHNENQEAGNSTVVATNVGESEPWCLLIKLSLTGIHLLPVQYSHQKFHFRLWITQLIQVDGAADEHEWIRMDALHQLSFSALLCSDQVLTSEYYSSCSNRTGKMLPTLGNSVKVVPTFGLHHF
ncbi:hypothetical protein POM88_046244 [Heracleum sosnowskyi]|uniref:Uncharacterized protein n=1 Tax=Heracleum sosnowskyi TaxID=360622 RepID=A0AAD8M4H9_9APIA|nr:hypothetical protein POM88_046244 [Heracleum sosnowskyi]